MFSWCIQKLLGKGLQLNLIMEDHHMKKALASVIIITFAGLISCSILATINSSRMGSYYIKSIQSIQYPFFIGY